MNTCKQRQQALIEDFALMDDWSQRYDYLIDLGKNLPALAPEICTDAYRVEGCQSQVWLHTFVQDGRIHIAAGSDAIIVRGLLAMVCRIYHDAPAQDILEAPPTFIATVGLERFLSPTRANGLNAFLTRLFSEVRQLLASLPT